MPVNPTNAIYLKATKKVETENKFLSPAPNPLKNDENVIFCCVDTTLSLVWDMTSPMRIVCEHNLCYIIYTALISIEVSDGRTFDRIP